MGTVFGIGVGRVFRHLAPTYVKNNGNHELVVAASSLFLPDGSGIKNSRGYTKVLSYQRSNKKTEAAIDNIMVEVFVSDHHVETAYRSSGKFTKSKRSINIVGGDFNAELGPGVGIERLSVGQYTLQESNKRGDWMKQWLMVETALVDPVDSSVHPF